MTHRSSTEMPDRGESDLIVTWNDTRAAIVDACLRLEADGLVAGASGNVSVRLRPAGGSSLVAITPSRVPYRALRAEEVLVIDLEGNRVEGAGTPSSETPTHLAVYRARPDVGAVIHTHSVYASALAVAGQEILPLLEEQVVVLGGTVRIAEYGMSATEELARHAVEALGPRRAVLLRNHGALGVGRGLDEALDVVALTERVAKIYVIARLLGEARPLPERVVEVEEKLFRKTDD